MNSSRVSFDELKILLMKNIMNFSLTMFAKILSHWGHLFEPKNREIKLKELLHEFHDLTFEDQISKLEFYCTEFGLYTSDKEASDFGKVPDPSLSEIQEVQSASFSSFREILNYWIALTLFFITFKVSFCRFLYICILLYTNIINSIIRFHTC